MLLCIEEGGQNKMLTRCT